MERRRRIPETDRIRNVPPSIIEIILCLLPIQEAARTNILSRDWRYHWIKIPKLAFIEKMFQVSTDDTELSVLEQTFDRPSERKLMTKRCKLFYAIYQVLLVHEGPIHDFTLSTDELDHGTLVCSKDSTIAKLFDCLPAIESLSCWRGIIECCVEDGVPQELPTALVHLKYLFIEDICFVYDVGLRILVLLIRSSPNLEKLKVELFKYLVGASEEVMKFGNRDNELDFVKLILAKSHVLKKVTIFLDEEVDKDEEVQILEILYRSQRASQVVKINVMRIETMNWNWKYSQIRYIYALAHASHLAVVSSFVLLMKVSPNLEKLKIENSGPEEDSSSAEEDSSSEEDIHSFTLEDYSHIWLEHMRELHIRGFINSENEMNFVRLVLAKSPVLKKVRIFLDYGEVDEGEELQILQVLLSSPHVSPAFETHQYF
ncbi:F-box/FBD/LRR-repeat protein-like protein [Tanacetum coccineum]